MGRRIDPSLGGPIELLAISSKIVSISNVPNCDATSGGGGGGEDTCTQSICGRTPVFVDCWADTEGGDQRVRTLHRLKFEKCPFYFSFFTHLFSFFHNVMAHFLSWTSSVVTPPPHTHTHTHPSIHLYCVRNCVQTNTCYLYL